VDLGLKEFLTTSEGEKLEAQKIYRKAEEKLATAQRAKKVQRVRAIHAEIKNKRKDFHHKLSTKMVRENKIIVVGSVSASGLAQTKMAKSVLDAGWSSFKTMLMYKSTIAGVWFYEVNESFTTQECNVCLERTGPKGLEGLCVREWTCSKCGTHHDRDTNAAINIKHRGLEILASEINESSTVVPKHKKECARTKVNKQCVEKTNVVRSTCFGVGHDPLAVGIPVL